MQKEKKQTEKSLEDALYDAILPVAQFPMFFHQQRMLLHEMYTAAVVNAPDDEIDNFTAKRLTPFYLALCQMFENFDQVDSLIHSNGSATVTAGMLNQGPHS